MSKTIIDDNTAAKVANLIKIKIPQEELSNYASQLNTALGAVEVLSELDTSNTKETSQTHGLTNVVSPDEVKPGLDMTKYKNTKNFRKGYFVVKKVL